MYALLILYLIGVAVWLTYIKCVLDERYEIAIVCSVFHPVLIASIYGLLTLLFILSPIIEIIDWFRRPKAEENVDEEIEEEALNDN